MISFYYRNPKDKTLDPLNTSEFACDVYSIQFTIEGGQPQTWGSPEELPDVVYDCVLRDEEPLNEEEIPASEKQYIKDHWTAIEREAYSRIGITYK